MGFSGGIQLDLIPTINEIVSKRELHKCNYLICT